MTTAQQIIEFFNSLELSLKQTGVEVLNPYKFVEVQTICTAFYNQYYNDTAKRVFMLGINPGRFGAGATGIPFTDPVILQEQLGIQNGFAKRNELSALFIYEFIDALGGVEQFYRTFFFSNASPLGFVKEGKNLNYYDEKPLEEELTPWMIAQLDHQIKNWGRRDVGFTIGKGKNFKFLNHLNKEFKWFDKLIALPHPRWVMQYRLKQKDTILDEMVFNVTKELKYY